MSHKMMHRQGSIAGGGGFQLPVGPSASFGGQVPPEARGQLPYAPFHVAMAPAMGPGYQYPQCNSNQQPAAAYPPPQTSGYPAPPPPPFANYPQPQQQNGGGLYPALPQQQPVIGGYPSPQSNGGYPTPSQNGGYPQAQPGYSRYPSQQPGASNDFQQQQQQQQQLPLRGSYLLSLSAR